MLIHTDKGICSLNTLLYWMGLFINFDFNNTALCGNFKIKLVYPPARYKGVTMSQVGIPRF